MLTIEEQQKITSFLKGKHIPSGLGTEHEACSIAAINLALFGKLTDSIPDCMSSVIGKWIIKIQDSMPDDMRNSSEWRVLLPLAAGTGRNKENERKELILNWMWTAVLPELQPLADKQGFGDKWKVMLIEKTAAAADVADADVDAAAAAAATAAAATYAAVAAAATYAAVAAAAAAAAAATYAAVAAAATYAAVAAAAAAAATYAAVAAAAAAATVKNEFWSKINPPQLLKKLINL